MSRCRRIFFVQKIFMKTAVERKTEISLRSTACNRPSLSKNSKPGRAGSCIGLNSIIYEKENQVIEHFEREHLIVFLMKA